jgi:hypothetical protein
MKKSLFILIVLFCGAWTRPAYSLTILSGPDTDGCYDIRVEGKDIVSDVSIFSDLYISRDSGKSWYTVFTDDRKVVKWLETGGERVIKQVNIPAGHYNAVKFRGHRTAKVNLEDRPGRPKREEELDFGEEFEFTEEDLDLTLDKDGNTILKFDNPLVYLDLHVRWDTTTNAYADPQIIGQVFKKDSTGTSFVVEKVVIEQESAGLEEE